MIVIIKAMIERYYPTDEQLFKLYSLLVFFKNDKLYWHKIWISGSTIVISTDPQKCEIDLMIFYIYEDGRSDIDEWENRLY